MLYASRHAYKAEGESGSCSACEHMSQLFGSSTSVVIMHVEGGQQLECQRSRTLWTTLTRWLMCLQVMKDMAQVST